MLQLHNLDKIKIKGLKLYKDYCVESDLSSGDKTLSFLYPARLSKDIIEECYIRTKTDEFVVKEINNKGDWKTIVAKLNVEDLEGKAFEHFDTSNETITACLNLALAGTGWTLGTCDVTRRRTVRKTNSSSWEIIQEAKKNYRVELEFNTLAKKINIFDKRGSDKGVYFSDTLNLRDIDIQGNSYQFYTRIIAIGKDNIRVTLENFQYSKKVKTFIWKDERYTDIDSLREDAQAKLNEISKPYRAYAADVIDLSVVSEKHKILAYGLGDTVTIVSRDKGIREKQRIAKMVEYPDEPHRNTCEIANVTLKFEDIQKEFQDTSDTVNNITKDDGTIDGSTVDGITTSQITDFEASVGKITDLTVVNAHIENLYAEKASIGELNAVIANIGELNATKANITELNAVKATITILESTTAKITDLTAINAKITVLEVDTASIRNLLAGNITGENIQAGGITSDKLTIANGFITNAMIMNLDVNKINAGTISTSKFIIKSDDGGIEIVGATQQFKDKNNRVRIQMGKDSKGNFDIYILDETGNILFNTRGITGNAIADDLIVKDMISSDAVGEKQIDYSSFATGFNKDTNTTTLKSTKIRLDNQNQTLDIAFSSLKNQADGTKSLTESNSTTIGIQQGQINTAINNTQIVKDGQTILLKDDYNRTVSTINNMSSTIGTHTSLINEATGKISSVETRVNTVERDLNGTKSTVSSNSSRIDGLNSTVNSQGTSITQLLNKIELKVEASDISTAVSNITIGGRNLINDSNNIVTSANNTGLGTATKRTDEAIPYWRVVGQTNISTYESEIYSYMNNNCVVGKEYTLSCDVRIQYDGAVGFYSGLAMNDGIKANVWTRIRYTFSYVEKMRVAGHTYSRQQLDYRNWKLETGNKDTDWTPAHEDTDKAIADTIIVTEEKIKQAKVEIKLETDSIKQSVSSVDSKIITLETLNFNNFSRTGNLKGWSSSGNVLILVDDPTYGKVGRITTDTNVIAFSDFFEIDSNKSYKLGLTLKKNSELKGTIYFGIYCYDSTKNQIGSYVGKSTTLDTNVYYYHTGTKIENWFDVEGYLMASTTDKDKLPKGKNTPVVATMHSKTKYVRIRFLNYYQDVGKPVSMEFAQPFITEVDNVGVIQSQLDTNTTTISTTNNKISTIETNLSGVTTRVTNAENTTKTLDGKVVAMDNRLKAAEVKITDSSIISTVQSTINTAKTEAINTSNSNTTNQLKNYSTTANMNTAITQSANSVKTEISKTYVTSNTASSTYATKTALNVVDGRVDIAFTSKGGSNLLWNTDFKDGIKQFVKTAYQNNNVAHNVGTSNNQHSMFRDSLYVSVPTRLNGGWVGCYQIFECKVGQLYTFSCLANAHRCNGRVTILTVGGNAIPNTAGVTVDYNGEGADFGDWQRVVITFTATESKHRVNFAINSTSGDNGHLWIIEPQLVQGNFLGAWTPNPNEGYNASTVFNRDGITIYNGAIRVLDGNGNEVLKGDSSGISFSGRLQPRDNTIKLFGEECKLEGGYGGLRRAINNNTYDSVTSGGSWVLFNANSNAGTRYTGITTDYEGHTQLYTQTTMLKLLNNGSPGVQSRWAGDGGYAQMSASGFTVASRAEYKENIHDPIEVDFVEVLKSSKIKSYNYKNEVKNLKGKSVKRSRTSDYEPVMADKKVGFVLDELDEKAREILHPQESDGIDLYAMSSVMWKVCQEQQLKIEELTKKVEQLLG